MAVASLGSAALLAGVVARDLRLAVVLGMAAPLAATTASWVLTERTFTRTPERLTGLMMAGFAAKMVFFGAYVAVMLAVLDLQPTAFVASFTGYFIALYLVEALLMRRMFRCRARAEGRGQISDSSHSDGDQS
jgi:hypothetical protein